MKKKVKPSAPKTNTQGCRVKTTRSPEKTARMFPIVAIGASASGLQALKTFFSHVPEKCGLADIILPPNEMPIRLSQFFALHPVSQRGEPLTQSDQRAWLYKIFAILRAQTGHDFSQYKLNTLMRRIKRFFTREGDLFHIHREIRDFAVFSAQDLIKDPPFSRLHLLCCRNLLIYLDAEAQKKLLPLFHYTLRPDGVLMLGSSKTIGSFTNLFDVMDRKWKIFKRVEVPQELRQQIEFPSGPSTEELSAAHDDMRNLLNSTEIATIFVDNNLKVKRFTPQATAIINLIQTDIGRPLQHVATNRTYTKMATDLEAVLKHLTPRQADVQTTKGELVQDADYPHR